MENYKKDDSKQFISEDSGMPDPNLIPEEQISEEMDRRMEKIFKEARKWEKSGDHSED